MATLNRHTKHLRYLLLGWFIMFALSPCVIKEAYLELVGVAYAKPLNKNKATTTSYCQYIRHGDQTTVARTTVTNPNRKTWFATLVHPMSTYVALLQSKLPATCSGNSPPKYILYKRLKIALA